MKHVLSLGILLFACLSCLPAPAEVTVVELPADYADFAMHPETGDIAAIDAETNQAVLFRDKDAKKEPSATVRVGPTPCSICYKQFGDMQVFAVVCSQDSYMYVIDAEKFELVKKVALTQAGVSSVTCSTNPEDPFLYYNYGGGHDSAAGVVSLRDLKNHGIAFDDSMDCAISADGTVAYRRGPWSPSGFESLMLTNKLTDEKPTFGRLFYDHDSRGGYLPGPFGRFTATGKNIYSKSLQKLEAGLNIAPLCFFRERPVIIGVGDSSSGPIYPRPSVPAGAVPAGLVSLEAASYNTFSSIGDPVTITLASPKDSGALPRGTSSHADFKRVAKRSRCFADDVRDRAVYASRSHLAYIPLEDFNLPDEPLLLGEIEGPSRLEIGKESELQIVLADERVETFFQYTPEGMKRDGNRLTWTPTPDQIGTHDLTITYKYEDIERTLIHSLEAVYPSISLPFAPAGMAIDAEAKRAVIWEGPPRDRYGRTAVSTGSTFKIAVIDLSTGKSTAQREFPGAIQQAIVTDKHAIVRLAAPATRCEALSLTDLSRSETMSTVAPVMNLRIKEGLLIVEVQTGIVAYDAESFEKKYTLAGKPSDILRDEGLLYNGVLYDFNRQPQLLVAPRNLIELPGADARLRMVGVPVPNTARPHGVYPGGGSNSTATSTVKLAGADVVVSASLQNQQTQVPGATHTWHTKTQLTLTASGEVNDRQVVMSRTIGARTAGAAPSNQLVLQAADSAALLACGTDLYIWPIELPTGDDADTTRDLKLVPRQSTFLLKGDGETVLKHKAEGGKTPQAFALYTAFSDAMSIDSKSGDMTVNGDEVRTLVMDEMEKRVQKELRGRTCEATMQSLLPAMAEAASEIIGRRPEGVIAALPVRVEVRDAGSGNDVLQYYVLAEVPMDQLAARMRELDQAIAEQKAQVEAARLEAQREAEAMRQAAREAYERRQAETGVDPFTDEPAESDLRDAPSVEALNRRIDALEQRLDLITRQLNQLLEEKE